MTDNLMWDYCSQHLSCCYWRLRFGCKAIFPEGKKCRCLLKTPLSHGKLNIEYFTGNPSFSQQVIVVELSWNSLIIEAAYGQKKKKSWKPIYLPVFSRKNPSYLIHSSLSSHISSFTRGEGETTLLHSYNYPYSSMKLFSWLIQWGYAKCNSWCP